MHKTERRISLLLAALLAMALGSPSVVAADTLTIDLNVVYSGEGPEGEQPWLRATFDDHGGTGMVTLTLETLGLTDSEFVSEWDFNLNPALDPANLLIQQVGEGDPEPGSIETAANEFKAGPEGFFDISFRFPTRHADRFGASQSAMFDISLVGIQASDFEFGSTGGFASGAHVQSIGDDGDSGWIGGRSAPQEAPEPSVLLLLGGGLLSLALSRRAGKRQVRRSS